MPSIEDIKKIYGINFKSAFYGICTICNSYEYGELVGSKFFGYKCLFPPKSDVGIKDLDNEVFE